MNEQTNNADLLSWWSVEDNMPEELEQVWVWWCYPGSVSRNIGIGYWTGCYLGWRLYDGKTIADVSYWTHLEKPQKPKLGENVNFGKPNCE